MMDEAMEARCHDKENQRRADRMRSVRKEMMMARKQNMFRPAVGEIRVVERSRRMQAKTRRGGEVTQGQRC